MAAVAARPESPELLSSIVDRRDLEPALLLRIADHIQAMHAAAAPLSGSGIGHLEQRVAASAFGDGIAAELARQTATLDGRVADGCLRHGHGDLRLATIALTAGAPVLLAAQGAPCDILDDLAGLLADLRARGLRYAANIVANRYVDRAPQGASGWALLPLFLALRAAHAEDAARLLQPVPPGVIVVGGLSGTGKTTLARLLGARLGRAPGARVLRSDVFRKRIAGVSPETRLAPASYSRHSDDATFAAMFESAADHLECGSSVILDGVFMSRTEREVALMLAERARVPFTGIWLEAPERDRIARVTERSGDASDAGVEVVREQSRRSIGDLGGWHRIRTNRPLELIVQAARAVIDRKHKATA